MLLEEYEKYWQKQEKRDETRVSPVSKGCWNRDSNFKSNVTSNTASSRAPKKQTFMIMAMDNLRTVYGKGNTHRYIIAVSFARQRSCR